MSVKHKLSAKFDQLRQQAEEWFQQYPGDGYKKPTDVLDLIHELSIHQAELEIQNEELKRAQEEISALHQEYEDLYEFAPCGYVTINPKRIITRINLAGAKLLGHERWLCQDAGFSQFIDLDQSNTYLATLKKADRTGQKQTIELPLKRKKGPPSWVRTDIEADHDESGSVLQWRMVLVDVTQKKTTETLLAGREEKFRDLYENAPNAYFSVGEDGYIRGCNRRAAELLGFAVEDLVAQPFLDLYAGTQHGKPKAKRVLERFRAGETVHDEELQMQKADGTPVWISLTVSSTRDKQGRLLHSRSMVVDITERKQAENKLRESERRLKMFFQATDDLIALSDANAHPVWGNRAWSTVFGQVEKYSGSPLEFIHPEDRDIVVAAWSKMVSTGKSMEKIEYRYPDLSGNYRTFESSAYPIKIEGKTLYYVLTGDITPKKQSEENTKKLEAQLQQSRKMDALGTLAGGIAHEFNNILGIILGNAEVAYDHVSEGHPVKHCLAEIQNASFRAKDVVKQILSFARSAPAEKKPIQISTVVKEVLKMIQVTTPTSIQINQNLRFDDQLIMGDFTEINQILINICVNATQAITEEKGVMDVSLELVTLDEKTAATYNDLVPGDYVKLTVRDTGTGIDPAIQDRVFDPFFTTKSIGEGSGMGLAIVYSLVKKHDGAVSLTSQVDKGTIVEVLFPVFTGEVEEETGVDAAAPTGSERILLVDDEPSLTVMLGEMLSNLGYDVVAKTSSLEAMGLFKEDPHRFDLVITDMAMPQMTGDQLAQELIKIRPDIPIIICSGHSRRMDEGRAKELGIKAYLMKPLGMDVIAKNIREVLDNEN